MEVFVGVNTYAGGEFLFVCRSFDAAVQNMREYQGNVTVSWDEAEQCYAVYLGTWRCGNILRKEI